jgi:tetratricopeptide (TPR) repeat protein
MIGFGLSGGFSLTARCVLMYLTILSGTSIEVMASPLPDEATEAEAAQIKAAERFLIVLEKNPRRGTALDRVYGHHVEFGSLDKFVAGLKDRTTADANDGTSWMLIGLIESQRGQDGNAVDAFRLAETNRPTDALASYYLAQSLLRIGQNEEAVAAFERAIERKPQRNDLLEIFQQLGRVHQRAQRTEEALKVWTRLESLFPDDPRVLEQIAVTLAEEGDNAQALLRYERLAKLVKDDYRRTMCLIEVAELNIKSGRKDAGIGDLEKVMAQLDPDGWIYKDVRRRIDDVFLRAGDQDSLVKYYEKWIAAHPEDVEGMARLAKFLAQSARVPEATQWMEKALKLAPSRTDLRKAFIDQLVDDQRIPEAIRQYEQLAVAAPGNPDFLRDWGKLVLKDRSQDPELRKKEAVRIWNQIVASRPDDAITTAQVADLFRQASLNDEAEALYKKAVSLAPGDPQYREYLGEFYHIQKKTDEALETWAAIAEGSQRTAENAARLAEVYNSFGYLEQAVKEIAAACALDPKEFVLQMRSAEYHARATKYDEALTFLAAAEKLAASDDDRDALIRQRIEVFQSSQRMDDETKKLAEAVHANENATPSDWALLARYYEASRQWVDATESVEKGLAIDPKSVPTLTAAARIAETSGNYGQAAEYSRRLADSDRRSRGDHLMNVARLEAQMGRSEQALAAANELIVTAPGNTDNYEFLAQMCFRLGKSEEGLEALRKAVRINPNEPHLIMALAAALADQLRTDEAIEVYWRAFDKSETLDDRTNLTQKLVPLYEQINQLDKLIERFERDRREEEKRREMTICLAQAWQTSGDYGTARLELERLLGEDSRDTNLLQQLSKLCETSGDIDAAIGYQRQLIAVAPGHETEFPLVAMLQSRGDRDEAMEILVRLTAREEDPARLLRSIDSLLNQGAWEAVIGITEPLLSQQREDWELLYREGVAWAKLEKRDEAATRFDRILALTIPHDTLGLFATDSFKRDQAKAKSENLKGNQTQAPKKLSPLQLVNNSNQVQAATGLISEEYYGGNSRQQTWTPREYGVARMASYAWKLKFEEDAKQRNGAAATGANPDEHPDAATAAETTSVADQVAAKAQAAGAQRNAVYDWLYVASLRNDQALRFQIARELAQSGGQEEEQFFLNSLQTRHVNSGTSRSRREESAAAKTPLSDDDLELMLRCVADLSNKADKNGEDQTFGQQIAYDGQGNAYMQIGGQWVMIGGGRVGGGKQFTTQVVEELKLAKRDAEADALLKEMYTSAKKAGELSGVISVMLQQETPDQIPDIFRRWVEAARAEIANPEKVPTGTAAARSSQRRNLQVAQVTNALMQWIGHLGPEEEHAQILSILDQTLDIATIESKQRLIAEAAAASKSRRTSAASTGRVQTSMQWIYGKQNQYIQIEWPTDRLDTSTAMLLRDVHEVLKKNDVLPDLVSLLRGRVAKASPEDEPFESAYLATELWWSDEQDEAVEILVKISESQKNDPNARFELAELRSQRGDIEDALEIVDTIIARDQKLLQRRELMALTLAERLGDHERARTAAERLFGLRLDSATQLTLVDGMRRLGMTDMADAVIARTERQSSNQPPALASLMMLYQSQGKADRAKQLAHMLLRKTVSPMTTMANATRNPNRYRTNSDSSRTQALTVLQQTGELKTLIGQLESQLERAPESSKLYGQLIEFYGITGQQVKVGPLLEKAIASRPEAVALRLQLAKHWQQTGKTSEACDQYLFLMKQKPDWIFDDFYQIRNLFQAAKRNDDVVAALKTMNLKNISQPYYIIDFVGNLLNDPSNEAIGLELLDKVVEAYPSYRSNLISNIRNPKLWQSESFFELGKKMVIPTEAELKVNPWSGLKLYSYSGSGKVSSQFHILLQGLKNSPRLDDLRKSISETAEKNPGWHAGSAMIALIDLQQGKKVEARTRLQALVVREDVAKSMPYDAGWLIAQELDEFQETRELALALLEKAIAGDTNRNEFQYTPGARLIKVYIASGRREDARALLIKSMQNHRMNTSQPDYEAYQRANNSLATANYFLEMNYTVDAVKVYQDMLNDEADLKLAGSFNRDENRFLNQAKAGLSKAMAGLDSSRASEAIEQLLTVQPTALNAPSSGASNSGASKPALDLLLKVPSSIAPSSVVQESIDSGLVILLVTLAKDDKIRTVIDARLETLQTSHPTDASIALTLAAFRGRIKDARFAEAVQKLEAIVSDQPLEEIAEGRRPNSRQRKEAALAVPLWIVAREAMKDETLQAAAAALANRALAGAKRQTGLQHSGAILLEWSSRLLDAGKKERGGRETDRAVAHFYGTTDEEEDRCGESGGGNS